MKTTHLSCVFLIVLLVGGIFLALPDAADAGTYRTQGYYTQWYTWSQSGLWQVWSASANTWQAASVLSAVGA